MSGTLDVLGLSREAQELYARVIREAPATVDQHATALGWHPARARACADELAHRQLAWLADGVVQVASPAESLEQAIRAEEGRLDERRQELTRARAIISEYSRQYRESERVRRRGGTAWEVLAPEAARGITGHLVRSSGGQIRSMTMTVDVGPSLDEDVSEAIRQAFERGRQIRTIYPFSLIDSPEGRAWVARWEAMGQVDRFMEEVPSEFAVFGDEAVVTSAHWGMPSAEVVVIHEPLLVQAFTSVFDQAWGRAVPSHLSGAAGRGAGGSDRADRMLLELLATGLKDEAMARHLGVSLRTVRRRIADLMVALSAESRFQLGVQAQSQGLLEPRS